jgi:hypothetical protein
MEDEKEALLLAKKKIREKRVAAVDANGVLMRDLKATALWISIAVGVVVVMAILERTLF